MQIFDAGSAPTLSIEHRVRLVDAPEVRRQYPDNRSFVPVCAFVMVQIHARGTGHAVVGLFEDDSYSDGLRITVAIERGQVSPTYTDQVPQWLMRTVRETVEDVVKKFEVLVILA